MLMMFVVTQKIFLVVIFMLGSYVVFTSIYRFIVYLSYSQTDVPYSLAIPVAWNLIEISSGIVSSCLPTLVWTHLSVFPFLVGDSQNRFANT